MALRFDAEEEEEEVEEEEEEEEEAVLEEEEVLDALGPLRCGVDDALDELEVGVLKKEEKKEGGIDKYSRINKVAIRERSIS
jgi:hypothetical protein